MDKEQIKISLQTIMSEEAIEIYREILEYYYDKKEDECKRL